MSLSALSTQVAQQSTVLLSPGMHICLLDLTALIVLSSFAWEYAFHCCVFILNLLRSCHAGETQVKHNKRLHKQ